MKVKILQDTVADGRDVYKNSVVDISEKDAQLLINLGKAQEVKEEKRKNSAVHER